MTCPVTVRAVFSSIAAALILAATSACAAPSQYMGIAFAPGAASPDLQALAQRAQAGDKRAQLELGIAYEEGRGVAVDSRRAITLYRLASRDTGGTTWIYVPGTRKGEAGRVMPVNTGVRQGGLAEVKVRLERLENNTMSLRKNAPRVLMLCLGIPAASCHRVNEADSSRRQPKEVILINGGKPMPKTIHGFDVGDIPKPWVERYLADGEKGCWSELKMRGIPIPDKWNIWSCDIKNSHYMFYFDAKLVSEKYASNHAKSNPFHVANIWLDNQYDLSSYFNS